MAVMGDDDSNYANHNNQRQFSGYFLRYVDGGNHIHVPPVCALFRVCCLFPPRSQECIMESEEMMLRRRCGDVRRLE